MNWLNRLKVIFHFISNNPEKAIDNISEVDICKFFDKSKESILKIRRMYYESKNEKKLLYDENRELKKRIEQLEKTGGIYE